MTIASEIQDLNTNLTAAKNAVTTKGGTVGNTGLAGLATEIASIPSGGSLDNYGTVKYTENGVDKTVTMVTAKDFEELALGWQGVPLNINGATLDKEWITEVTVAEGVQYLPDNFLRMDYGGNSNLTTVNLPSTIQFIGTKVFYYCSNLNSDLNLSNVTSIGTEFMNFCNSFNKPISLLNILNIENYFMFNCTSFNSAITFGNNLTSIGTRFMASCTSFTQSVTIPSSLTVKIGERFMNGCNNFTGPLVCNGPTSSNNIPNDTYSLATTSSSAILHTTGVTLLGVYAQDWKNTLPDRTSSPYRKLIVAS